MITAVLIYPMFIHCRFMGGYRHGGRCGGSFGKTKQWNVSTITLIGNASSFKDLSECYFGASGHGRSASVNRRLCIERRCY